MHKGVALMSIDQSWRTGGGRACLASAWGLPVTLINLCPRCLFPPRQHPFHLCPLVFGSPWQMLRFGIDVSEQELTAQESAPQTLPPSIPGSAASSLALASTLVPKASVLGELKLLW